MEGVRAACLATESEQRRHRQLTSTTEVRPAEACLRYWLEAVRSHADALGVPDMI